MTRLTVSNADWCSLGRTRNSSPAAAADPVEGEEPNVPALNPEDAAVLAWISAIPLAYMLPFLMGFENAIGILIIGFALWQAFRMNTRSKIELQGPFRLEVHDAALG